MRTGRSRTWPGSKGSGGSTDAPVLRRVTVPGVAPHRVYRATLRGLEPGGAFAYRVRRGGELVFSADGRAPKATGQPYRFAVFGDCAAGTAEQKAVAYQTYLARPDFVLIAGDIVYTRGRISEYREKFWPVYNSDAAALTAGAPLLRSTLFVAAPGNHDLGDSRPGQVPRRPGLFPLLGPAAQRADGPGGRPARPEARRARGDPGGLPPGGRTRPIPAWRTSRSTTATPTGRSSTPTPMLTGPTRTSAPGSSATWPPPATPPGDSSPSTILRSTPPGPISATSGCACWPRSSRPAGSTSSGAGTFITTSARSRSPSAPNAGLTASRSAKPTGSPADWTLDTSYDGRTQTRPHGVIYIITGAGGASLYNPEQQTDPASWQAYTHKFLSQVHSLTIADVDGPEAHRPPGLGHRPGARSVRGDEVIPRGAPQKATMPRHTQSGLLRVSWFGPKAALEIA